MAKKIYFPTSFYTLDLTSSLRVGSLPSKDVIRLFKDGRVASHVIDMLLPHIFDNITRVHNKGAAYDLRLEVNGRRHKAESKTITQQGLKVMPSGQIGKGREFDKTEAIGRVLSTKYYIVTDITTMPVPRTWVLTQKQVSDIVMNHRGSLSLTRALETAPNITPTRIKV